MAKAETHLAKPRKVTARVGAFRIKGDRKQNLYNLFDALTKDLEAAPVLPNSFREYARDRMLSRMRKRVELRNPGAKDKALDGFKSLNLEVSKTVVSLPDDVIFHARDFINHTLERYVKRQDPTSLQETLTLGLLFENWRFGPKASNGVLGLGTVEKIDQSMTCTRSAEPLVRLLRMYDPYFSAIDCTNEVSGITLVQGSRLTTVLKNEDEERVIAIEPSGNMALQLAGASILESAMRMIGLDIKSQQPKNQALARRGSLYGTHCTIDLKKASDRRTRELVKLLWPEQWYSFTEKVRSPIARLSDGTDIELSMTSTMGNGLTFPMMTLEIVSLIYAVRRIRGGPHRFIDWANTCVFGDDIIVPTCEYDDITSILQLAGYVVNHDKSYKDGPFRESCGGDYYLGYDVTPVYIRSISTIPEVYVVINQILLWASKHEIPCVRTLSFLKKLLPSRPFFVPEWFPDSSGIRTARFMDYTQDRQFKYLRCIPVKREYKGKHIMRLCIGGFLEQRKDGSYHYNIHPEYVMYRVDRARMSLNYLDGWDPLLGSLRRSTYASLLVSLM